MIRILPPLTGALLAVLAASCANSPDPQVACTLIGCNDGLRVTVGGAVPAQFTVRVLAGDSTLRTVECRTGTPCDVFIENTTPEQVTVEIASTTGVVTRTATPEYTIARPNGPNCPPECRQGEVAITL